MQAGETDPSGTFAEAVRLAAALARPLAVVDPSHRAFAGLTPREIDRLALHPPMRRPLERLLLQTTGLGAAALGSDEIARLSALAEGRLALLLVREPLEPIADAALLIAAAALHRAVLRRTNKVDRQRLREVMGQQAHLVATQEAPTLHAGLAVAEADTVLEAALDEAVAPEEARRRLAGYGLALLVRIAADASPAIGAVVAARFAETPQTAALAALARQVPDAQSKQFVRFIRRRVPAWSAIIG